MAHETAQDLIDLSIHENRITHAEFTEALAADLAALSDDSAETDVEVEYWGVDDGNDWRVHLTRS